MKCFDYAATSEIDIDMLKEIKDRIEKDKNFFKEKKKSKNNLKEIIECGYDKDTIAILDYIDIKSLDIVLQSLKDKDKMIYEMAECIHDLGWDDLDDVKDIIEYFRKKVEMSKDKEYDFLLQSLENEIEENKRLRKQNKNTIKCPIIFNDCSYELDTQIVAKLDLNKYYYLSDNYSNPTKVKLIQYEVLCGIDKIIIVCACNNMSNNKIEYYNEKSLFTTKNKASDAYLANKYTNKGKEDE